MTMKTVKLGDILTDEEIQQAIDLADRQAIEAQLVRPNMERINAALGQENDPTYMAFAIEYVLRQTGNWGGA